MNWYEEAELIRTLNPIQALGFLFSSIRWSILETNDASRVKHRFNKNQNQKTCIINQTILLRKTWPWPHISTKALYIFRLYTKLKNLSFDTAFAIQNLKMRYDTILYIWDKHVNWRSSFSKILRKSLKCDTSLVEIFEPCIKLFFWSFSTFEKRAF